MCIFDVLAALHDNSLWSWDKEMAEKFKEMCTCGK